MYLTEEKQLEIDTLHWPSFQCYLAPNLCAPKIGLPSKINLPLFLRELLQGCFPLLKVCPPLLAVTYAVSCVNPLTTDDAIWRRLTLAACYQLAQSVLKMGFMLAKKVG